MPIFTAPTTPENLTSSPKSDKQKEVATQKMAALMESTVPTHVNGKTLAVYWAALSCLLTNTVAA